MIKNFTFLFVLMASLALNAQDRITLIETFTSSTCGPCNPGNINLEGLLANATNDGKQVSLKYQMNWPGNGDPYYTDEGQVRRDVYGIGGIPASRLDGNTEYNTGSLTQNHLNTAYAVPAEAAITAYYTINEAAKTVDVEVDVEMFNNTPPGIRLYVAIFEYETNNNVESNGENAFFHVMKKMLPDASGTVIPPLTAGEHYYWNDSYTFNGSYRLPNNSNDFIDNATEHSVEQFADLGVAVFVQQLSTREVYQAGYAQLSSAGFEGKDLIPSLVNIYPNPTDNETSVAIQLVEAQNIKIDVYDVMGNVVYTETKPNVEQGRSVHAIETSALANGMYTLRVTAGNDAVDKRLIVNH